MAWWLGGLIGLGCGILVFLALILLVLLLSFIFNHSIAAREARLEKKYSAPKSLQDSMEDKLLLRLDPIALMNKMAQEEAVKFSDQRKIANAAARRYRLISGIHTATKKCFVLFLIAGFIIGAVLAGR